LSGQSTAIVVTQLSPAYLVNGDDRNKHIEHDLLVTNAFSGPITLNAVEIEDESGNTLMQLSGDQLVNATQTLFDQKAAKSIASSSSVALEIDLILPKDTAAPVHLSSRISYKFSAAEPLATAIGSTQIKGPVVTVNRADPVIITSPVSGAGWVTFNGCCAPNVHRNTRIGAAHRIATSETFAIDWVRIDDGKLFSGDGKRNEDFPFFSAFRSGPSLMAR
jgi:hypothetical protein